MVHDGAAPAEAASQGHGERIVELDGMRGIAIALVIALHAFIRPHVGLWIEWLGGPVAGLLDLAFSGVDVFFVLSGFLIGGIILDRRGSPGFYPAFYARRTTRIMPPYFLLVALAYVPFGAYGMHALGGTVPLLGYLTFTANLYTSAGATFAFWLGPLWSICIEEQFYLVSPIVLRAMRARWIPWLLGFVVLGSAALRSAMLFGAVSLPMSPWDFTLCRLDGLALGVLAAWLVRRPEVIHWGRPRLRWMTAVLVLMLFACAGCSQLGTALLLGPGVLCISVTAFAALLLLRLHPDAWLSRWFRVRPLVFLGRYSYFLYLFHMPALWLAHKLIAPGARVGPANLLALDALAMIALCAVAVVSWRVFETPLLALGRRVRYGRAPRATQSDAPLAA